MAIRQFLRDLQRQVDTPNVSTRPADRAAYAYDAFGASGDRHLPYAVVFPGTPREVAGVIQVCNHHGVPAIPRGAGTGKAGGAVAVNGGVIVSTARLNAILGLERDAGRLHVEAGTVTARVHAAASAAGLYYPPDPITATTSTIGGNVAYNAAGARAFRYGSTRDYVAGVGVVTANGQQLWLGEGTERDDDLVPLIAGSEGTLGFVTDVLLRLLPAPAARATATATFARVDDACAAGLAIIDAGVIPAALELLDDGSVRALRRAGGRELAGAGGMLLVEVEGDASRVNTEGETVRSILSLHGAQRIDHASDSARAAALWSLVTAVPAAVATLVIGKVASDVVVPRQRVVEMLREARTVADRHQVDMAAYGHLAEGHVTVSFLMDPRIGADRTRADLALSELFTAVVQMGGSISGEDGVGYAKRDYVDRQLGRDGVAVMSRLKAALDPMGILNPGKKLPLA